jgi:hypothetical protein
VSLRTIAGRSDTGYRCLSGTRKIIIMIKAGAVIGEIAELLEPGDTLIEGGNAKFHDTDGGKPPYESGASTSSAAASPPGMIDGPFSAPSYPPRPISAFPVMATGAWS